MTTPDLPLQDPLPGETLQQAAHSVTHKTSNAILTQVVVEFGETVRQLKRMIAQLHFPRTNSDVLRTFVDSGSIEVRGINFGWHGNATTGWFTSGAPNSADPREAQRSLSQVVTQNNRSRWSVT